MKKKLLIFSLAFAIDIAFAQQASITVAVLPSDGDGASLNNIEEDALTGKMQEVASNILPPETYTLLRRDAVIRRLGGAENYIQECKESSCIVDLGKKAMVNYVAQASVNKLDGKMRLKVEVYDVGTEGLVGIFNGEADDIRGLIDLIDKNAPDVFRRMPGVPQIRAGVPSIVGGITGVQIVGGSWTADAGKLRLVNLTTEPAGASLSFNGLPSSSCAKSPCKVELPAGRVRIIAALDQYEIADSTVFVDRNNQNINIRLKPNFGILEIKSAYLDGMGRHDDWHLIINDKVFFSLDNRLPPDKYKVKLSHSCYEDISFEVGINKGSHEVFYIDRHIKPKQGGLVLSAERDGEPSSEPVFVNKKYAGETPFSGTVAVCSEIELGRERVNADVILEYQKTVSHKHNMPDSRDRQELSTVKRSEAAQTDFKVGYIVGGGVSLNMNDINPNYFNSLGGQIFLNIEFYRRDIDFFNFGLNFDFGWADIDNNEVRKTYPNMISDSSNVFNVVKCNIFLKLYLTDFLFLSGGTGYGWYFLYSKELNAGSFEPENIEIMNVSTPIFVTGGGLVLGSGDVGFVIEGIYNIVPFQGRVASYISINAGLRIRV